MLKQGGVGYPPYSKVGGQGAVVSQGAQPDLFPNCFATRAQSGSPEGES